jgi:hypothetical protein
VLGNNTCVNFHPVRLPPQARTVSVGRRAWIREAKEIQAGRFRCRDAQSSFLEYRFEPAAGARFVALPHLEADHDVVVSWHEGAGPWRPTQNVRLLGPRQGDLPAVIDLQRLINWSGEPVTGIRIGFTHPGLLAVGESPRLLR